MRLICENHSYLGRCYRCFIETRNWWVFKIVIPGIIGASIGSIVGVVYLTITNKI